jgi:hypothetical protein
MFERQLFFFHSRNQDKVCSSLNLSSSLLKFVLFFSFFFLSVFSVLSEEFVGSVIVTFYTIRESKVLLVKKCDNVRKIEGKEEKKNE